jgi:hypothetical protein
LRDAEQVMGMVPIESCAGGMPRGVPVLVLENRGAQGLVASCPIFNAETTSCPERGLIETINFLLLIIDY